MAICPSCGKEIRDDIWTCGFCGAPVAQSAASGTGGGEDSAYGSEGYNPYASQAAAGAGGYGTQAYGAQTPTSYGSAAEGMTPYGTPLPQAAPASSGGLSQVTKLALVGAAVAIVAIVAVWFFVLRGSGGGDQFVGTWTATEATAGSLFVEQGGGGLEVTIIGADDARVGPLKTDLDGDELEIKLEAAGGDETNKAAIDVVAAMFEASVDDFKMTLRLRDSDGHLILSVSGTPKSGGDNATMPVAEYVKAGAGSI
jgi:hypothetical protein